MLKNIIKSLLVATLSLAILTACDDGTNTVATPTNPSGSITFTYKFNGIAFKPNVITAYRANFGGLPEPTMYITAYKGTDSVAITCPAVVGTHSVSGTGRTFIQINNGNAFLSTEGTVTISEITATKITGTFSGGAPNDGIFPPFSVTEGEFKNIAWY
jgi:hypothetical protein